MVDEKELEEKEYYRRRLSQWRDLGFDITELEIMLETDFDRLKSIKFDKLKEQLHRMTSEESIPKVDTEVPGPVRRRSVPPSIVKEIEAERMEKEGEKEDPLLDIRSEMSRRKARGELQLPASSKGLDDGPLGGKGPEAEEHGHDYPLISFNIPPNDSPKRSIFEEEGRGSRHEEEMTLVEQEVALIRRKRRLLEEEEARLHRRRRILAGLEEEEDDVVGPDDDEDEGPSIEGGEEEPALIFVGRGRDEAEVEDEEEPEHDDDVARISVAHGAGRARDKLDEDEEALEELLEEVEEVESDLEDEEEEEEEEEYEDEEDEYEEEHEEEDEEDEYEEEDEYGEEEEHRPRKRSKVRKVPRKRVKKARRSTKARTRVKKRRRPKRFTDDRSKVLSLVFTIVIVFIITVLALWSFYTPGLVAKIGASQTDVTIGEKVEFEASGSESSGNIKEYVWDFDDGTPKVRSKTATHIFTESGTYTVKLKIKDDSGSVDEDSITITVRELTISLPAKMIGDDGSYDVEGTIYLENEEDGLLTVPTGDFFGGAEIKIVNMTLDYYGPMTSKVLGTSNEEDGFGEVHQCLHSEVGQDLDFDGLAESNTGYSATITGEENLRQQIYLELKTNHTIKTVTASNTQTDPITITGGFQVAPSMTSKDDLKSYTDLGTIDNQVSTEDLFRGESLDTSDPSSLQGQMTKGQSPNAVIYSWTFGGVDNVYDRPAVHLIVTIDDNTLAKLGLTKFSSDIWFANDIPTYVKIHTYLEGTNGTTFYTADNTATMTDFTGGTQSIPWVSGTPHFHTSHPLARVKPFNITPPEGDPNATDNLFPAQVALDQAMNHSNAFRTFMNSGSPFVISGNYSERSGITWNLTFGKKGSDKGYTIMVSWITNDTYQVEKVESVDVAPPGIGPDQVPYMLTIESAEDIFRSDAKVQEELFSGGMVDYQVTTLYLDAETPYPNLDFTLTSISATSVPYTYTLSKQVASTAGERIFSTAVNAENGQLMFVQEHTGDIPF